MSKLTPIQESINYWEERYNEATQGNAPMFAEAAGLFVKYLRVMERQEKEFVSEVFQAGADFSTDVWENRAHTDKYKHPDHQQFLSQYYPKEVSNGK